jgi:hypothetical protein
VFEGAGQRGSKQQAEERSTTATTCEANLRESGWDWVGLGAPGPAAALEGVVRRDAACPGDAEGIAMGGGGVFPRGFVARRLRTPAGVFVAICFVEEGLRSSRSGNFKR